MTTDLTSINRKFMEYHRQNPNVYLKFKEIAYEMHIMGETKLGAKHITEIMRWRYKIKVSNLFTSRYARMFTQQFPSYRNLFILKPINEEEINFDTKTQENSATMVQSVHKTERY